LGVGSLPTAAGLSGAVAVGADGVEVLARIDGPRGAVPAATAVAVLGGVTLAVARLLAATVGSVAESASPLRSETATAEPVPSRTTSDATRSARRRWRAGAGSGVERTSPVWRAT
jgi:hypothetical protein